MIFPDNKNARAIGLYASAIILILLCIRVFILNWYSDNSSFMYPTIADGSVRFVYNASKFNRGDIVVAKFPDQPKRFFRVVGVSGDRVSYGQNRIILNGQAVESKVSPAAGEIVKKYNGPLYPGSIKENLIVNQETLEGATYTILTFELGASIISEEKVVPQDSYYLIQDNRIMSSDSRYYGPISKDQIFGKIL